MVETGPQPDVIVVGGGNAGFCAALAAAERGRKVVVLERAREVDAGGNSYYTAGATRIAHRGLQDLADFIEPDERNEYAVVPAYTHDQFIADVERLTSGRNDPALTKVLATESLGAVRWLSRHGFRYRLMYERQAYEEEDGTFRFWGGLHIGNVDGGQGLIHDHFAAADRLGIDVRFESRGIELLQDPKQVVIGVVYLDAEGQRQELRAETVVLAAGGFEANPEMRAEHLGSSWSNAKVRGTPLNTGDMIRAALEIGAQKGGDWSTCHSVAWDAFAEDNESNRLYTNRLTRQSYPIGIVVNTEGQRFLDEGSDFRNYTYAKYGAQILRQPNSIAFQIFDTQLRPLLRGEEYDMPGISVAQSSTIRGLAAKLQIPPERLAKTIEEFNSSIDRSIPFDPAVKDGRRADTTPQKSNWAMPIETAPFYGYPVTCGITFTFGGLKADLDGRVLDVEGRPIPGLFVAGEMLGGLFSGNYPGGSGLTAGIVFGRRAGSLA